MFGLLLGLVVVGLLIAPVPLLLAGRRTAAMALLLVLLYTRISDLSITAHGVGSVSEAGLSVVSQAVLIAVTLIVFLQRTSRGASRGFADHYGPWVAMGLYLAVVAASSVWAIDEPAAAGAASSLLKNLLVVYLIIETIEDARAQRVAIWALLVSGVAMSMLTVAQRWTHTYGNTLRGFAQAPIREIIVGATNGVRAAGPIGDPNFYALILAVLVPLALLRARDEQRPMLRVAAAAIAAVLLVAISLTYSRAGLVTVVVSMLVVAAIGRVRGRDVAVVLVCLVAITPFIPTSYWARIGSIAHGDASIAGREGSQETAIAMFADHPLLGIGAENYKDRYLSYAFRLDLPAAADAPHNLYLAIAAETGLAGLAAFLAAMYLAIRGLWRRRRAAVADGDRLTESVANSLLAALITYLAGVAFLPAAYPRYLWVVIGLALAVSRPAASPESAPIPAGAKLQHVSA